MSIRTEATTTSIDGLNRDTRESVPHKLAVASGRAAKGSSAQRRPAAGARRGFQHIPALDGVRALGVLTVMGYHAGVSWLPGGLLGVDVFFVLSGFLITSLLLTEKRNDAGISLRRFWGRRARRLLPAMAVLLLSMVAWAQWVAPASSKASLRGDVFSTLLYVANWRFIFSGQGYFDHFGPQSPLLHTWSVAVEEQFYLIWPLLLVLIFRLSRGKGAAVLRRRVLGVALVGAAASAVLMGVLSVLGSSPDRLYYGTDTRALPLLLGCSLAALRPAGGFAEVLTRSPRRAGIGMVGIQLAGVAGTAGLVLCWLRVQDHGTWLYRGGFVVVAIAAAGVLLSCADAPDGPLARLLAVRPLRYIGAISYGLYLYHWPIFQLLTNKRTGLSGPGLLLVRFSVTFAVAVASYHLLEQPIRRGALSRARLRTFMTRREAAAVAPALSFVLVVALIAGLVVTTGSGSAQATAGGRALPKTQPPKPKPPQLTAAQRTALNRPVRVLLEGDSLAFTLGYGMGAGNQKLYGYQIYNLGTLGCGVARGVPLRDEQGEIDVDGPCENWPTTRAADVKEYDPDVVALLTGRWEVVDRVHDGQWMHVGEPAYDAYLSSELDTAIQVLSAGGAKVLLMTTPCFEALEGADGSPYPFDDPARVLAYNQLIRAAAARHPGVVSVYDLYAKACPAGKFTLTLDGVTIRDADGVHFTEASGPLFAQTLAPVLNSLGAVRRKAEALQTHANEARPPASSAS